MNIGAGRIVYQDLAKINLAIEQNEQREKLPMKDDRSLKNFALICRLFKYTSHLQIHAVKEHFHFQCSF